MPFIAVSAGRSVRRLFQTVGALLRDKSAGPTLLVALALPVVAGAVGVGVDVSSWYIDKRKIQQMADAAALAGARVKAADQANSVVVTVATNDAKRNGYSAATHALAVNSPPGSGAYVNVDGAVEAVVTKELKMLFASVFLGNGSRTISARAVAAVKIVSNPEIGYSVCMLSLIESGEKAIFMNGSGSIAANCAMAAWSTHARSVYLNGSGTIAAYTYLLKGGFYAHGSGKITYIAMPGTYMADGVEDPYADLAQPVVSGPCLKTNYVAGSSDPDLQPGRYCGGILNSGSGTVWLTAGTYYIDGGNVSNSGSGSILCRDCTPGSGKGVTLVFTSSVSSSLIGGLFSNGSGRIILPAPGPEAGEPYTGVVVYQDRRASAALQMWGSYLNGSGGDLLSGVVYLPTRSAHLNGSGMVGGDGMACLSIIAQKIELIGSGKFEATDCGAMGAVVPKPKIVTLMLVE